MMVVTIVWQANESCYWLEKSHSGDMSCGWKTIVDNDQLRLWFKRWDNLRTSKEN